MEAKSRDSYFRKWGKYRIAINGLVYDYNGKLILDLGEEGYELHKGKRSYTIDRMIETKLHLMNKEHLALCNNGIILQTK